MKTKDHLSKAGRSWNMSRVRSKNTTPEKRVRSMLHQLGFRFRLHAKSLPGIPDIVLPKYRTVIFVHGCFWHLHKDCKKSRIPTHQRNFWLKKLNDNVVRDKRHQDALRALGWHAIVIWECATHNSDKLLRILENSMLNLKQRHRMMK
jgi:DNA mismatch endonuclease (patch repair protein)